VLLDSVENQRKQHGTSGNDNIHIDQHAEHQSNGDSTADAPDTGVSVNAEMSALEEVQQTKGTSSISISDSEAHKSSSSSSSHKYKSTKPRRKEMKAMKSLVKAQRRKDDLSLAIESNEAQQIADHLGSIAV